MDMDRLGDWIIDGRLGEGGMGTVYRCHHASHPERLGALKVVRGPVDAELYRRFTREAWVLQGLTHPGVVRLLDVLLDGDPPALVMELAPGQSLRALLRRGALNTGEALDLVEQLADALAHLHARGVFHRDLKPSNIMVGPADERGRRVSRLVDFGIALETERTRLTRPGFAPGTARYTPPEWLDETPPDPARWDLFSLGVVLTEVLVGRLPYVAPTSDSGSGGLLRLLAEKERHLPLDPGPPHPPSFRALVRAMTERAPQDRLASAEAVLSGARGVRDELEGRGEPLLWLRCLNGAEPGRRYPLRYGLTRVGRGAAKGEGITLDLSAQERDQPRRWVSRVHAELDADGARLTLTDLGSANGSWRNDTPVPRGARVGVEVGDRVGFGRLEFRVEGG